MPEEKNPASEPAGEITGGNGTGALPRRGRVTVRTGDVSVPPRTTLSRIDLHTLRVPRPAHRRRWGAGVPRTPFA